MIKIIIAGGRNYNNYEKLKTEVDKLLAIIKTKTEITIITGGANGTDAMGKRYAIEHGYKHEEYNADWNRYGSYAGPLRNKEMANNADRLIALWDGKSRGTSNMITEAQRRGLKIKVIAI